MKNIIQCLGAIAVVLAVIIVFTAAGYGSEPAPKRLHTAVDMIEAIEPYEYIYYDVPLTEEQQREIQGYAHQKNVPYEIVLGVMYAESNFRPEAVGDSGNSLGIMQVQPKWHAWRLEETGGSDWMDAVDNAKVGIHILAEKLENYGNVEKALVVYNMGDGGARGINSTAYSQKVLNYAYSLY